MTRLSILGRVELVRADGTAVRPVLAQPKRTALLAYLALRGERGASRELLVETFWPELEPERGRAALRKGLHFLRRALGPDTITTVGAQVAVSPTALWCDVVAFENALAVGDPAQALDLYRGELLPGLVVAAAPDWEVWLDGERARLRRLASDAGAAAARAAESAGDAAAAWRHLTAALDIDPADDAALRRLLQHAARTGEVVRGLQAYEAHSARLAAEWEVEPTPECRRLAAGLAQRREADAALAAQGVHDIADVPPPLRRPASQPVRRRRRRGRTLVAAAAALLLVLLIPVTARLASVGAAGSSLLDAATAVLHENTTGHPEPDVHAADVASRSLVALRFYQEGLRLYMGGRADDARALFAAALAEDSSFAMPAYYLAVTAPEFDHAMLARAVRLSERRPERERLLIHARWLQHMDEPRRLAVAESLVVRHPREPEGYAALGRAQFWNGDFAEARRTLGRVVAADSTGRPGPRACRACDAWFELSSLYLHMDSAVAAERVARAYLTRHPHSDRGLDMLLNALEPQGRYDEMQAVLERFASLSGDEDAAYDRRAVAAIRQGRFTTADSLLMSRRPLRASVQARQLWTRMISLRNQARYAEALELAAAYERLQPQHGDSVSDIGLVLRGIVLHEAGEHAHAAALFERVAARAAGDVASRRARHRAWNLTHAATSYAALGDTVRLRRLADTVQRFGSLSAYGRDRRLHHHIRGLDAALRGDTATAIRHLEAAVFSATLGYTRTNLELGRLLNAVGRHAEAIAILEPALRGTLSSSQLYVTHAALHEQLLIARLRSGDAAAAQQHEAWLRRAGGR